MLSACGGGDPAPAPDRDADGDRVLTPADCDDLNGNVFPGAPELCNGLDDDCDGEIDEDDADDAEIWYLDGDLDGVGDLAVTACERPDDAVTLAGDCDDMQPTVFPGALEVCDGLDNDCNGAVDDEIVDLPTWYADGDQDGFGDPDVASMGCEAPSGFVADGTDCDDDDAGISPDSPEYCDDGLDNDCDQSVDEADAIDATTWHLDSDRDGAGDPGVMVRACVAPTGYVADASDCDDTSDAVVPGANEVCDTVDNDCDGEIDEDGATGSTVWYRDADGDGYGDALQTRLACRAPVGYVADGTDCNDADLTINPATIWYFDADGDGFGAAASSLVQCASPGASYASVPGDCQPNDPTAYPGAPELCIDGEQPEGNDNDCDGTVDETCPVVHCGTITADQTWVANANGHLVTCNTFVEGTTAPVLTIEAGATVRFAPGAGLYAGWTAAGDLVVDGTDTDPVLFTSASDTPAAGDWTGVFVWSGSTAQSALRHATIEYAGDTATVPGGLNVQNASPLLDHVTVRNSERHGLYVNNGEPLITDSSFVDNADYGVLCQSAVCLDPGPDTFDGNTLRGNRVPIRLAARQVGSVGPNVTVSGNVEDRIEVTTGTVDRSATWYDLGAPYRITGDIVVNDPTAVPLLTLGGGTVLEFEPATRLLVGVSSAGDLTTDGTATVTLTSSRPSPLPGDWDGLFLGSRTSSATVLDDVEIAYGVDNLYVDAGGFVVLDGAWLHHAQSDGLEAEDTVDVSITNTELSFNGEFGARLADNVVVTGPVTVDAHDNGQPLQIPAHYVHRLDPSSSLDGNALDRIVVRFHRFVASDVTWAAQDARYYVEEAVYVGDTASRPTLTIADGATLSFAAGTGLFVGVLSEPGDLVIDGDPLSGSGVLLTSESGGGPGSWIGITLVRPSTATSLRGFTLRDAGSSTSNPGGIGITGGTPTIADCRLEDNFRWGIHATGVAANPLSLTVSRCTIADTGAAIAGDETGTGLYLSNDPNATVVVDDVTITGSDYAPVQVHAATVRGLEGIAGGSSYTGNGVEWIHVHGGTIQAGLHTWNDVGVPYYLHRSLFVEGAAGPVLSTTNTTFLVGLGRTIEVARNSAGDLFADGVTFTSARDVPLAGDWRGLLLGGQTSVQTQILDSTVAYGGDLSFAVFANVQVRSSDVSIVDSTIRDSSGVGIQCTSGAAPTLSGLTFASNAAGDTADCP